MSPPPHPILFHPLFVFPLPPGLLGGLPLSARPLHLFPRFLHGRPIRSTQDPPVHRTGEGHPRFGLPGTRGGWFDDTSDGEITIKLYFILAFSTLVTTYLLHLFSDPITLLRFNLWNELVKKKIIQLLTDLWLYCLQRQYSFLGDQEFTIDLWNVWSDESRSDAFCRGLNSISTPLSMHIKMIE